MTTPYDIPKNVEVKPWEWVGHDDFRRDPNGYGEKSHNLKWPNNAEIAVF